MSSSTSMDDVTLLVRAADFAAIKHRKQKRKDAEATPYIVHPLGVAKILTEEAKIVDVVTIAAAMLHDTVEDTDTSVDELIEHFGKEIAGIVNEVTDDKSLPKPERKRLQIVNGPHKSHKAKLVKLADKLYNVRDLDRAPPPAWDAQRVQAYFQWTHDVMKGLRGTNSTLEKLLNEMVKKHGVDCSDL